MALTKEIDRGVTSVVHNEGLNVQAEEPDIDSPEQDSSETDPRFPIRQLANLCLKCNSALANGVTQKKENIPYYNTFSEIKQSASSGCSICSQFISTKLRVKKHIAWTIGGAWIAPIAEHGYARFGVAVPYMIGDIDADHDERNLIETLTIELIVDMFRESEEGKFSILSRCHVLNCIPRDLAVNYDSTPPNTRDTLPFWDCWFQDCLEFHQQCQPPQSEFKPTRVIALDSDEPYICLTSELHETSIQYATLSHRWGFLDLPNLKKNTVESFRAQIPISALSRTFQDAITVCEALNIKYLWIDSLCIIQDCKKDWEHESALMAQVYGSGVLNVAATSSLDGNGGCFHDRPDPWMSRVLVKTAKEDLVYNCYHWNWCELKDNALSSRGWLVQERYLSKRTLHFTETQVFWECDEQPACEAFFDGVPANIGASDPYKFARKRQTLDRNRWRDIIDKYVKTDLTYGRDRLVAIAGLAQEVQSSTNEEYIAGFWRDEIEDMKCLVWYSWGKAVKNLESANPSWSWASLVNTPKLQLEMRRTTPESRFTQFHDLEFELCTRNRFADINNAVLRLRCTFLSPALVRVVEKFSLPRKFASIGSHVDLTDIQCWFDLPEDAPTVTRPTDMFLLRVMRKGPDKYDSEYGTLLQKTGESKGQYRRVGYFFTSSDMENFEQACGESNLVAQQRSDMFSEIFVDKDGKEHYIIDLV
jgi:hypothetical protein